VGRRLHCAGWARAKARLISRLSTSLASRLQLLSIHGVPRLLSSIPKCAAGEMKSLCTKPEVDGLGRLSSYCSWSVAPDYASLGLCSVPERVAAMPRVSVSTAVTSSRARYHSMAEPG
jgi:hypothetical protein